MSLWRQLTSGLRALANRRAADREVSDEIDHYLEEAAAAFAAQGLSADEAWRAAKQELGSATAVRQQVRGSGWEHSIDTFFSDLRHAARRLRANPGFTTVS